MVCFFLFPIAADNPTQYIFVLRKKINKTFSGMTVGFRGLIPETVISIFSSRFTEMLSAE